MPVISARAVGVVSIVRVSEVGNTACCEVSPDAVVYCTLKSTHCIEWVVYHVVSVQIGSHVQELVEKIRACGNCSIKRRFQLPRSKSISFSATKDQC